MGKVVTGRFPVEMTETPARLMQIVKVLDSLDLQPPAERIAFIRQESAVWKEAIEAARLAWIAAYQAEADEPTPPVTLKFRPEAIACRVTGLRLAGHDLAAAMLADQASQVAALTAENARLRRELKRGKAHGVLVDDEKAELLRLRADLQQAREQVREAHWYLTGIGETGACMSGAVDNPATLLGQAAKALTADRDRLQRRWDALRAWLRGKITEGQQQSDASLVLRQHVESQIAAYLRALAHLDHLAAKERT